MASLANKHIVIVGGSSGIGLGEHRTSRPTGTELGPDLGTRTTAVGKACLAENATVTICSSSPARLQSAVQRLGGGPAVRAEVVDVKDEASVKAVFEKIGAFDHLIYTVSVECGAHYCSQMTRHASGRRSSQRHLPRQRPRCIQVGDGRHVLG
jgi:NAD(P)-dependent dehydrogenase (short-subunit alcohol dehydrogenase family)